MDLSLIPPLPDTHNNKTQKKKDKGVIKGGIYQDFSLIKTRSVRKVVPSPSSSEMSSPQHSFLAPSKNSYET